jgi:two-component sensor histidine kinase
MRPFDIDDPSTIERVPKIMERLPAEKYMTWEGIHLTKDRRSIPVEISNHLFDLAGVPTIVATVRDITERKRAENQVLASLKEKELLLKEIHHRVKNNMQVISSLLSLATRGTDDERVHELFRDSMGRIRSMALVHEKLYRSSNLASIDFGEYVSTVTSELMRSFNRAGVECRVDAGHVLLGIDTAIPCGLIVNELVSNALKHAFRGRERGTVAVFLRGIDSGTVELVVQDDGIGLPSDVNVRSQTSMGMIVVNSLVDQIAGSIAVENHAGTRFIITFPRQGMAE